LILPEVTDFLSGKYFEDFDETTKTFTRTQVVRLKKAINLIGSRYLVMSYGINSYTHALVYDLTTKRWSKLKIPHVDCFEFLLYPAEMTEIARQSIGFLASDGAIFTVNLDANDTDIPHNGVLILGKYQYVRSRTLCLERVEIENVRTGTTFSLHDMVSIDGKNISSIVPGHLRENSGGLVDYDFHTVGMNHSLLLMGSFYAQTLQLTFVPGGDR
jgi:hypothetical protein